MRVDGRVHNQLRPIQFEMNYIKHPEGSVMITVGDTRVICNASIDDRVPPFLRGSGKGWITAEYSMLPRATEQRNMRESTKGKISGRTMEIQRLIGRALRSVVNLEQLGEKTIWIDCDVIQADGGTRTASITGAFVAMVLAVHKTYRDKKMSSFPISDFLAAISVGVDPKKGEILDLNYIEDSAANVDMNVVMTGAGEFVELQGTGEESTFSRNQLQNLLELAEKGIHELIQAQKDTLGDLANLIGKKDT